MFPIKSFHPLMSLIFIRIYIQIRYINFLSHLFFSSVVIRRNRSISLFEHLAISTRRSISHLNMLDNILGTIISKYFGCKRHASDQNTFSVHLTFQLLIDLPAALATKYLETAVETPSTCMATGQDGLKCEKELVRSDHVSNFPSVGQPECLLKMHSMHAPR